MIPDYVNDDLDSLSRFGNRNVILRSKREYDRKVRIKRFKEMTSCSSYKRQKLFSHIQ